MCETIPGQTPVQHLVHEWEHGGLSRREFFERALMVLGTATAAELLLASCSPAVVPTPTSAPAAATATTAPAATATTVAPAAATATTAAPIAATATSAPAATATSAPAATATTAPAAPSSAMIPGFIDPSAVDAATVTFPNGAVQITAYQARPKGAGPWPAVIVIHENRGLTDHFYDLTRRVANLGYVALGVDYLSRSGGTGKFAPPADPSQGINALKQADVDSDTVAAVAYLKSQTFVKPKVGIMGFCWGGANSLSGIINSPDINASIVFYGRNPANIDDVQKINGSVMGNYGSLDNGITPGVPALDAAMKKHNKPFEYKIYEGAAHAFFNDTGPRFHEASAKDAWARLIAFFARTLA